MDTSNHELKTKLGPVLLGIHIAALPLYPHLPLQVLMVTAVFTLWTWLIITGRISQPGRLMMLMLTMMVVAVLMQSFGTILGQMPGSAMLLMLSFLKLFEMKSTRDIAVVIFMGLFLVASKFFFSQSLLTAIYVFVVVVYLTSLLIVFSDRLGTTRFNARMYKSLNMIIQAVPLMLILFVLFPRVPGPLWGLPEDVQAAATGISDEMSPGSINQLIGSGEVAFRVKFDRDPPRHSDLYWRGLVLSNYDGRTWRPEDAPADARPLIAPSGDEESSYKYKVMLEPHNRRWLFSLETMTGYEGQLAVTREMQVLAPERVRDVISYIMRSDIKAENKGLFEPERRKYLALPDGLNSESIEYARALFQDSARDDSMYINNVLKHFSEAGFVYTLSPPLLGENAMDEFLFSTRRGFCEHFASAFVYLMRAAGIPSRVVIGYQGGAMHPFDDYMIVRQSDAHAWAEVWLGSKGWVRVDPTAAVSPTRIEEGIEHAGLERDLLPSILISDNAIFQRTRYMWDSFHNSWNQWVVGYNRKRQQELLGMLGFNNVTSSDLAVWLVVLMTLTGGLIAWWVIRRESVKQTDLIRLYYDRFCRKLAKAGMPHRSNEGATEFLNRAVRAFPAKEQELAMITGDYEHLRYGGVEDEDRVRRYIRTVRRFKVRGWFD